MRIGTYYRYLVTKKLGLPLSGNKVLDIGCYDGFLLSYINSNQKTGIDIDCVNKYPDIRYIQDDFLKHDFANERFDRVYALDILEHVNHEQERIFLEKMLSLLSPDGIGILSTPSKTIRIFPPFLQEWADRKWQHIYRRGYTRQEIGLLIDTKDTRTIYWNCPLFRFLYLPLSLLWRISPPLTRVILRLIVKLDFRLRNGERGFLYLVTTKKS